MDSIRIKKELTENMIRFIGEYRKQNRISTSWKEPLLGFADADGEYIRSLKKLISPTHYLPQDFLPGATVVLSYFLPFSEEIGRGNEEGNEPSEGWCTAYKETNQMFPELNRYLTAFLEKKGFHAVTPSSIGMIDDGHLFSNWSQRHIAYAAGLGTFGVNNMLITEKGICGRFYSLITDLPVSPDLPLKEERCLYKKSGGCGLCAKHCPAHALVPGGTFDQYRCNEHLMGFEKRFGQEVCGKCVVGLPCTYRIPESYY